MRGRIESITGDRAVVRLDTLQLDLPTRGLAIGPADLVIRPEAIHLGVAGSGMTAQVSRATYMGSHTEYLLATSAGELFCVTAYGGVRLGRTFQCFSTRMGSLLCARSGVGKLKG